MYHTILVPLDGSPFGERALPMAAALARAEKARIVLVRASWTTDPIRQDQPEASLSFVRIAAQAL